MNQVQSPLTFEESIKQVMKTLPPVIRHYLAQGKYTAVARDLMTKYHLRIDQGGVLEREIMLLLMGVENPDEFVKSLATEAYLDQEIIKGIVQDVNAQIFVPLRAEEMRSTLQPRPAAPAPSPASQPPASPLGPQSHFHLQNKIAPPPRPVGASASRPALREALASAMDSSKLLEDHEEPHIELGKKPTPPTPPPPVPARPVAPLPQNLPGQMPPVSSTQPPKPNAPAAPVIPRVIPSGGRIAPVSGAAIGIPPAPPTPPAPPKPEIPASYSVDPYREPIDEENP